MIDIDQYKGEGVIEDIAHRDDVTLTPIVIFKRKREMRNDKYVTLPLPSSE